MALRPNTCRVAVLAGAVALAAGSLTAGAAAAADARPSTSSTTTADAVGLDDPKVKGKACKKKTGVTVVIDFLDLQNKKGTPQNLVRVGCALGEQPDRITAITAAGFDLTTEFGGAFACRIDERPYPEESDCLTQGYWLNSHADDREDDDWEFTGIAPIPAGSYEGWIWTWAGTTSDGPRVLPRDIRR